MKGPKMEFDEAYSRLRERAIDFHQLLLSNSIYQESLSADHYLSLIEETLSATAEGIASGRLDRWVAVLGFCESLLYRIEDYLPTVSFDVTQGPREHMAALEKLLGRVGYRFSWMIDDNANVVHLKLDDIEWEGSCVDGWWAHEPPFTKDKPNLIQFLQDHGWFLYAAGTGDALIRYLLVPPHSKEALKKYLIPGFSPMHPDHDPRIDWFYEGVPEDQRPGNLWEI